MRISYLTGWVPTYGAQVKVRHVSPLLKRVPSSLPKRRLPIMRTETDQAMLALLPRGGRTSAGTRTAVALLAIQMKRGLASTASARRRATT